MEDIPTDDQKQQENEDMLREIENLQADLQARQESLTSAQMQQQQVEQEIQNQHQQIQLKNDLENQLQQLQDQNSQLAKQIEEEERIALLSIPNQDQMNQQIQNFQQNLQQLNQQIQQHQERMEAISRQHNIPLLGLQQINPLDLYDEIIQLTSLSQLIKGIPYQKTTRPQNQMGHQSRIAMIGMKGKGKTFILQKILNSEENQQRRQNLQCISGQQIKTEGISVIIDKSQIYFDIQAMSDSVEYFGINPETGESNIRRRPRNELSLNEERKYLEEVDEKMEEMNNRQGNLELFIRNFVIAQCQTLIIAVGILTFDEQIFINDIIKRYPTKQIYIIHNIQEVENLEQLNRKIASGILNCYPTEDIENLSVPEEERKIAPKIYLDQECLSKYQVQHLVIGQENKDSGKYNKYVYDYIKKSIPHVCQEFSDYNLIKAFNLYFNDHVQNNFNFAASQSPLKAEFLQSLETNQNQEHFKIEENLLINNRFKLCFAEDFRRKEFIKHPLQVNKIGGPGEHPYFLCETSNEYNLFIPIPFADPATIWRRFSVAKNLEINEQQFEFKYRKVAENINQEVYLLINICPITQNLQEFNVKKSNGTEVKRFFKEIKTSQSEEAGYKHYKFVKQN